MLVLTLLLGALFNSCHGLDNGLALTPPMGWLSWAGFGCAKDCTKEPNKCISANLIKRTADRLASDGYLDTGYKYLVIDNCWMEDTRAPDGRLVADRERFPLGMKQVADYVHSKDFKFGLYYGNQTCVAYPAFMDIEKLTVDTFAELGVDYVKLNACLGSSLTNLNKGHKAFGKLLNNTRRDIIYSSTLPLYEEHNNILPDYNAIAETFNLWRNNQNIESSWKSIIGVIDWFGNNQDRLAKHAGPGHWNDPDMLVIGNSGVSEDQAKVQMAVWAVLAAPLLMSTDLNTIKPEFKEILLNKDIIGVNQDVLGMQGLRILQRSQIDVWRRELHDGSVAIAFVNRRESGAPHTAKFTHADLQLPEHTMYPVMDLYNKKESTFLCDTCDFSVAINPTGVKFYKFTRCIFEHDINIYQDEIRNKSSEIKKSAVESSLTEIKKQIKDVLDFLPTQFEELKTRTGQLETECNNCQIYANNLQEKIEMLTENINSTLKSLYDDVYAVITLSGVSLS